MRWSSPFVLLGSNALLLSLILSPLVGCRPGQDAPTPLSDVTPSLEDATDTPQPSPETRPEPTPEPSPDPDTPTPTEQVPLEGFGLISGQCGVLDDLELTSETYTELYENRLDFEDEAYDESLLSEGGQTMAEAGNAGGSSLESEVIAYELLYRCELASLLKTETEIDYDAEGSITDILVAIDGFKIGVSVTRAMTGPSEPYELDDAERVLTKKLEGINESSQNVSEQDRWEKQILHVLAPTEENGETFAMAYALAEPSLLLDTLVILTITDGNDDFIY